ncbi:hypothetical protein G9A89_020590 [Geosiphon pyriformis]|nr:hypothetical protein G9A89_020590 [Geosiphon pyriformis]
MVLSAVGTFKKKWFKSYDKVFTKSSSRFHKLELLVSKLVKVSRLLSSVKFTSLLNTWEKLNVNGALMMKSLFLSSSSFDRICSALAKARKSYRSAKLLESKCAEESCIRVAIDRRMKSFESDKGHTIRSVLEHLFHKVVLDHLVVGNKLILEPSLVKARVDEIMEGWTRKRKMVPDISDIWSHQYMPLEHVFDGAFSGVMSPVGFNELFNVVSGLLEGKAAAWISIIPKPYEWEGVLMNTQPIALIETAHKIISKILSDRILLACSTFDVLRGDNFSVLKGTTTQSLIFAIGSVIEDALEKNHEL